MPYKPVFVLIQEHQWQCHHLFVFEDHLILEKVTMKVTVRFLHDNKNALVTMTMCMYELESLSKFNKTRVFQRTHEAPEEAG